MKKVVRIGNASGFWGDEPLALKQQLSGGPLDYIVLDYLAEVSMSILSKQQAKNPQLGYIADFIEHLELAKDFLSSPTKIVTNAGGNNPSACAQQVMVKLKEWGIHKRVFAVEGDNLFPSISSLLKDGNPFENLENKISFDQIQSKLVAANAYTNSEGIIRALACGADIIITGRASDSALAIGPLRYEFGWKSTDVDLLGSAMIAGHIIECGTQSTGGNFTDWQTVPSMETIGFPIIEMEENGDFIVTKHPNTGGLVSVNTVKEQLVYEIAEPTKYMGPDVIADLSSITMVQIAANQVKISGCKGHLAPATWKVSMAYAEGYKAMGSLLISGPNAKEKANKISSLFWTKLGIEFKKKSTQFIGYNASHLDMAATLEPNEILIQFVAFDDNKKHLEVFSKQIAAMILTGPQGIAATGGRPKVQDVVRYWPTLVKSTSIQLSIYEIEKNDLKIENRGTVNPIEFKQTQILEPSIIEPTLKTYSTFKRIKMYTICLARSGDKGNSVNIGVIARSEAIYAYLYYYLTEVKLKELFAPLCKGKITRYTLPTLLSFNFLLEEALDGGGTYSGRIDPQGKTFASALLSTEIDFPEELLIGLT